MCFYSRYFLDLFYEVSRRTQTDKWKLQKGIRSKSQRNVSSQSWPKMEVEEECSPMVEGRLDFD